MKKTNNKKGFTLAELLIVVAIIAVMVAISIPIFMSKLERSREATDIANMRSAKAAAVAEYLDDNKATGAYFFDAVKGELKTAKNGITGYGKGTKVDGKVKQDQYDNTADYTNKVIKVTIDDNGTVTMLWE